MTALGRAQTELLTAGHQACFDAVGVGLAVLVQVALGLEGEPTGVTGIGPLPRVGADVFLKDAGLGTWSATVRAHVLARFLRLLLSTFGRTQPLGRILAALRLYPVFLICSC